MGLQQPLAAQPVISPQSIALGGSGTAYLSGFETTFWNPANLAISNRPGTFHFGVGPAGILYEPILSDDAAKEQFLNFTDRFYPYRPGSAAITEQQREAIIAENYSGNSLLSQHESRVDVILAGALWQSDDEAFSIVARTRMASHIEVGRGWYSDEFTIKGNRQLRDFTLNQWRNQLYELSFGYARAFTFFNGLSPRLNKLFVGIAPKIIVAGPRLHATFNARYIREEGQNTYFLIDDYHYRSTGKYTEATSTYMATENPARAVSRNLSKTYQFRPTGYGLGFDFGLTYLIPLGDDLPMINPRDEFSVVSKSIRISLSVTDIGLMHYSKNPLTLSLPTGSVRIAQQAPHNAMFIGAEGQYFSYFDNAESLPNPFLDSPEENRESFSTLLPTTINTGFLVELPRLKLMGGLTLGLNNTAFTSTKLMIHGGLELWPVRQIPLRLGTRLAAGLPPRVGLGTGFKGRYWDFNIGTQIILRSQTLTSEFVGAALAGIQIHL